MGFNLPFAKWISTDLKEFISDNLSESRIKSANIFNHEYINKVLDDHYNKRFDNSFKIWSLLQFIEWQSQYIEGKNKEIKNV